MPNWCFTSCYVTGNKKDVRDLYDTMKSLEDREQPLEPNGFGKTWLGNLIVALGGDWNEIYCRGEWSDLRIDEYDNAVRFSIESAWSYPEEFFDYMHRRCPGIDIYFLAEEPSMDIYVTNDVEGFFYSVRYAISYKDDETYYDDKQLQEFLRDLGEIIGTPVSNIDEIHNAVADFNEVLENDFLEVKIFDVIK